MFLLSSIKCWNSLQLGICTLSSLGIFKHCLLKYLQFPTRNYLFYIGDHSASISHTPLGLKFSALKYHLFQKNCCLSPACLLCNAPVEDPEHYFLHCPSFVSLCGKLFASAVQLLWNSDKYHLRTNQFFPIRSTIPSMILTLMLYFQYIQSFISLANIFC